MYKYSLAVFSPQYEVLSGLGDFSIEDLVQHILERQRTKPQPRTHTCLLSAGGNIPHRCNSTKHASSPPNCPLLLHPPPFPLGGGGGDNKLPHLGSRPPHPRLQHVASLPGGILTRCHPYRVASSRGGILTRWRPYQVASLPGGILTGGVLRVASSPGGILTGWHPYRVASSPGGILTGWHPYSVGSSPDGILNSSPSPPQPHRACLTVGNHANSFYGDLTTVALPQNATSHAPSCPSPRQHTGSSSASLLLVCQDSASQPANQTQPDAQIYEDLTEAPPPAAVAMDTAPVAPVQVKEEGRRGLEDAHMEEEAEPRGGEELDISFDSSFPDLISDLITEEAPPPVVTTTMFPAGVRYMVPPQPSPSSSFLPFPPPQPSPSSQRLAAITDFSPEWSYPEVVTVYKYHLTYLITLPR
ncbi:Calmodulin-binding transcription activator 1 [Dissostichus eleginoides]|uniref:Calmodulin-binding transcription activator 1 n=1 Tax=Dissostichus eleginoides TaxID=100907 RepID=A0AAD9BWG4_DISEL|nr:Calmodulin-binding transcription activator 1 [Dissostichus eleginoides]